MRRDIIDASQLELEETVVSIKRVTKVVKGGRNMRFAALVVVGDKHGHVGAGLGKAAEIPEAIRKGKEDAIKNLITVPMDENNSIPYDIIGKFGSAEVLLKRAKEGTGVIAGGPARSVAELAGITNIRTKSLGSKNKQNVVLADVITPISLLRKMEEFGKNFFLLESVEGGEKWARYSFLGYEPVLHITCKNGKVTQKSGEIETTVTMDPMDALRKQLEKYKSPKIEGMPTFLSIFYLILSFT